MKVVCLLISLLLTFFLRNEKLDKCNGIDIFTFGTAKEHFKNLTLELEEGNAQLYTVNSENLKINSVPVDYIGVSFIKNKLSAVSITTKKSTGPFFFKYLKEAYGLPVKIKNKYEWSGKHVSITFEMYVDSKDAAIDFYSR